jgi:hypothetical protein
MKWILYAAFSITILTPFQAFAFPPRIEERIVLSFSNTSSTLSSANKVALARHLPRINSISLEVISVLLWTSQPEEQIESLKFNQLNIKRERSIRNFFIDAGLSADRIYVQIKSLNAPAMTNRDSSKQRKDGLVEIEYIGYCKEGYESMCFDEGAGKAECLEKGGTWDRTGHRPYGYCVLDTKEKCVSRGGIWGRVCLSQSLMCVRKFNDGGKACSDSNDCESQKCVAVGREANEQGVTIGECVRTSDPCGSFNFIINGKPTGLINYD